MTDVAEMVAIPEDQFTYTFDQVAATQDSLMDREDGMFALVSIPIGLVRTWYGEDIPMSDEEIEDNEDGEYIEALIRAVQEAGASPFPPVVVIEREDHYEWIDGCHRMTALHRAGVETTMAYVMKKS